MGSTSACPRMVLAQVTSSLEYEAAESQQATMYVKLTEDISKEEQ
jgi:hypothetical protein